MARAALATVLLAGLLAGHATTVRAAPPPPLLFGLNDAPLFHPDPERALDLEAGLGSTVERLGIQWRNVQPRANVWDWGYPDQAITAASGHGLGVIAVISAPGPWASKDTSLAQCARDPLGEFCLRPPAPNRLADLGRFARALALRYPSIVAIEVWNEPNLGQYNWQPEAEPEYYVEVLRTVHDAVNAVRPALPVISGGIGAPGFPSPSGSIAADEFLKRMYRAGARGAMDGISVHPYPTDRAPEDPGGSDRLMRQVRDIRDANGDEGLPLWVTETGYTTTGPFAVTPDQQAAWLAALVKRMLRQRDVRAVVVHTLADRQSSGEEGGYGLVTVDFQLKPAYAALAAAVREVASERAAARRAARRRAARRRAARRRAARRRCLARRRSAASVATRGGPRQSRRPPRRCRR